MNDGFFAWPISYVRQSIAADDVLTSMPMTKRTNKRKQGQESRKTPASPSRPDTSLRYDKIITWGLVLLSMLFVAIIRIRLLSIPLERDEGEFAYMGQLMLQGIPPYSLAANMKLPGTYAAYALIMALFGQTIEAIHLGLLLVNLSTMLMVFFLARRLFDDCAGAVACATFGILSLSPSVLGTSAHATHFVLLPALGGILLLLKALDADHGFAFFLSGFFLGLAFIMKQPGIFFGIFALVYLLATQIKKSRVPAGSLITKALFFISGLILPYAATCIILYTLGVFPKFWFWTVSYASEYGTSEPLAKGIASLFSQVPLIIDGFYLLWILAGAGMLAVLLQRELKTRWLFMCGLLVCSFLAVCPGLYFREHYFILALPAAALGVGIAVKYAQMRFSNRQLLQLLPPLIFLVCFFHSAMSQRLFFFSLNPAMACRYMYFPNPFPESIAIADYIRSRSAPDSTIAVLGSEPQIYFYAHRRSATSYIYTYSLMENHKYALTMQQEMIKDIERNKPDYLIYVKTPTSWLRKEESNMTLLDWFKNYQFKYSVTGIIDIVSPRETKYLWDDQAKNYRPQADAVFVLKRNAA